MTRPRGARVLLLGIAALSALLLADADPAGAHAALVESSPEPGAELTTMPGVVTLRFSEPLIERLSEATVTDPSGGQHHGRAAAGQREIRVVVSSTQPGVYEVRWKTVSPLDGHALSGRFRFGVGVNPGPGAGASTSLDPTRAGVAVAAARVIEYTALLLALGAVVIAALARRHPALAWARPPLRVALGVALAAGIVAVFSEALDATRGSFSQLGAYLGTGQGTARLARLGTEALALVAALVGSWVVTPLLIATMALLAATSHAAASSPEWWAVTADALHLLAAGVWAGGVLALATLRPPGGWRGDAARELLRRFSPPALTAFAATIAFGIIRATQELAAFDDLVGTSYGRVLGIKILLVVVMAALSALAWARRNKSLRREALVAVGVLAAAALLAAYPLPPQRLAEADAAAHTTTSTAALPQPGDLTMAGTLGDTVLGLTVRPGQPGRNRIVVALVPVDTAVAADMDLDLVVGDQRLPLDRCGTTCRTTTLTLHGSEHLTLDVHGAARGTVAYELPQLPAPDGTALLDRLTTRMDQLTSYRLDEVFGPTQPLLRSHWTVVPPDRLHIDFDTGAAVVRIGENTWRRDTPTAAWKGTQGAPVRLPAHIWDIPVRYGAHVLGTETIDGHQTHELAFFGSTDTEIARLPIWYRTWVDENGTVYRAEMRTTGHFMDHEYSDFDAPVRLDPPTQ